MVKAVALLLVCAATLAGFAIGYSARPCVVLERLGP